MGIEIVRTWTAGISGSKTYSRGLTIIKLPRHKVNEFCAEHSDPLLYRLMYQPVHGGGIEEILSACSAESFDSYIRLTLLMWELEGFEIRTSEGTSNLNTSRISESEAYRWN